MLVFFRIDQQDRLRTTLFLETIKRSDRIGSDRTISILTHDLVMMLFTWSTFLINDTKSKFLPYIDEFNKSTFRKQLKFCNHLFWMIIYDLILAKHISISFTKIKDHSNNYFNNKVWKKSPYHKNSNTIRIPPHSNNTITDLSNLKYYLIYNFYTQK